MFYTLKAKHYLSIRLLRPKMQGHKSHHTAILKSKGGKGQVMPLSLIVGIGSALLFRNIYGNSLAAGLSEETVSLNGYLFVARYTAFSLVEETLKRCLKAWRKCQLSEALHRYRNDAPIRR